MKIGIVGSGFVGATAAYAMVMQGVGREIVLVDKFAARAQAEADDIFHAVPFAKPLEVRAGEYADLAGCRVVVLTAGVNQQSGETRLQLLGRNAAVFGEIVPQVLKHAPETVLVVATNPVDVMTHFTARIAAKLGHPRGRVLGSGTTLDTARFRALLGRKLQVDPVHVHAYVIGEHGDSEVLTWSVASVGGIPLEDFLKQRRIALDEAARLEIDTAVRRAAYNIIAGKRATYYGIGGAIARIVAGILNDQRTILTVCSPIANVAGVQNVTVALPHLLGGCGIIGDIPLSLTNDESAKLAHSAGIVRAAIDELPS